MTALVANPARKLCPEKTAGSKPAASTRLLVIVATAFPDRRLEAICPCRSMLRKIGLFSILAWASQSVR